jgi:class 3 adenylate cyclase
MPIFMDRHFIEGASHQAIADAHEKDLKQQSKFGVKFLTYWFDEEKSTAFCLVDAPDRESIQTAHNEAHGDIPHEIIEVDPGVVQAFLGRIDDPPPEPFSDENKMDSAFRAIMFTDLKDSTLMTSKYGDNKALHLLNIHNLITRNALRLYRGNEVKHTGDGIMASFVSPEDAVKCAIEIQLNFADYNRTSTDEDLYVRIGISAGEPIEDHGDLFGTAVQLAARLCSHAQPEEIVVSETICEYYQGEDSLIELGDLSLKGFHKPVPAYRVDF